MSVFSRPGVAGAGFVTLAVKDAAKFCLRTVFVSHDTLLQFADLDP